MLIYRWHHHRLPAHLSDFAPDALAFDPLSTEPFVYQIQPNGAYEISSKGRPDTGKVELVFKGLPSLPAPSKP